MGSRTEYWCDKCKAVTPSKDLQDLRLVAMPCDAADAYSPDTLSGWGGKGIVSSENRRYLAICTPCFRALVEYLR